MGKIFLLHGRPYDPVGAAETDVYFSTGRPDQKAPVYNPGAGARLWPVRVVTPLNAEVTVFDGAFGGAVPTYGVLALDLGGGDQDALVSYFWDGRAITVYRGEETAAFGSLSTVFKGTAKGIRFNRSLLTVSLRDAGEALQKPAQPTLYAGTGNAEGGDDIKGKPKPMAFGKPRNIEPTLISLAYLVYQFHSRAAQAVDNAYDGAVALTPSSDHASYAALIAATVPPGSYATCLAEGLVRLGAPVRFLLTLDVQGDNTGGFVQTGADIVQRHQGAFSSFTGGVDAAAFAAMNSANSSACSLYVGSNESPAAADLYLMAGVSLGAFWTVNAAGKLVMRQVAFGTSVYTLTEAKAIDRIERLETPPPFWRHKMGYARCWRTHAPNEIAAAADGGLFGIAINKSNLMTALDGSAFIHGLAADGSAADIDGGYLYGGQVIAVPRNQFADQSTLKTSQAGSGYIVHDADPTADVVRDDFAGANNTNLTAHTPDVGTSWTKESGTPNLLLDGAGKVKASATSSLTNYSTSPSPAGADYMVEIQVDTWASAASKTISLQGRRDATPNYYSAMIGTNAAGAYQAVLLRVSGFSGSLLAGPVTFTPVAGQKFRLKMIGSTISMWMRGPNDPAWVLLASVTDATLTSAGKAGLAMGSAAWATGGTDTAWRLSAYRVRTPTSSFTVSGEKPAVVFARFSGGNWQYDTGSGWSNFMPTGSQVIIGTLTRGASSIAVAAVTLPQVIGPDDTTTLFSRGAFVRQAQRFVVSEDAAVKTRHLLAREAEVTSLLDLAADAATENARQHALLDAKWDLYQVPVQRSLIDELGLVLGDTITLKLAGRFGLGAGRDFIIGGMGTGADPDETVLLLFG